jgi:thiol-disulfide isomerase/thioredoxin
MLFLFIHFKLFKMRKIISSTILFLFVLWVNAQEKPTPDKIIYGQCLINDLKQAPYAGWFTTGFDSYIPDQPAIDQLKKVGYKDLSIEIFFGSWCGDSKREVPRALKVLSAAAFPEKQIRLIGLGATDSLYKRSPVGEEKGKGIYRVPTFIIYKNGKELGRINEFPVYTFERDLFTILTNKTYTPNYASFTLIHQWETEQVLTHSLTNMRSLAAMLKPFVDNEHLLNSVGNLFITQGKLKEALAIYKANYLLYPESGITCSGLGKGFLRNGEVKTAVEYLEYALQVNKKPEHVKDILQILYEAKEAERGK